MARAKSNVGQEGVGASIYYDIDDLMCTPHSLVYSGRPDRLHSSLTKSLSEIDNSKLPRNNFTFDQQHQQQQQQPTSAAKWMSSLKFSFDRRKTCLVHILLVLGILIGGGVFASRRAMYYLKSLTTTPTTTTTTSTTATIAYQPVTSASYKSYVSMTVSGRVCQRWNMQQPHSHNLANVDYWKTSGVRSIDAAKNYCRDPDRTGYPWCFTTDPGVRWESCNVDLRGPQVNLCASVTCPQGTLCQQVNNTHHKCVCKVQVNSEYPEAVLKNCVKPIDYDGYLNVAITGEVCRMWTNQDEFNADNFPKDASLEAAKNYCRSTQKFEYLWCFTASGQQQRCYVDLCGLAAKPCL